MNAEFISKDITKILLRPSTELRLSYEAGQYIKILHSNGDLSPLSIANAPEEKGLLELHLTHSEDNLQARDILRMISEEKKLILRGPYGSCTASELSAEQPIIFLARGTGFAPIKAIIENNLNFNNNRAIHFYWSVRSPEDFYLDEVISQWTREIKNFSFTPIVSRQYPHWQGRVGLLQDILLQDYPTIAQHQVYVCAPESVVHDILHVLQQAGLPRNHFYSDVFDYDPSG